MTRFEAAHESGLMQWFENYKLVLEELEIRHRRNILNFDEAGFRIGCMKGQEVLLPPDIRQFYAVSPENRRSATIMETINAAGDFPPPPMIIPSHDYHTRA